MAATHTAMRVTPHERGLLSHLKPRAIADLSRRFRPLKFVLMPWLPRRAIRQLLRPSAPARNWIWADYPATSIEALSDHSSSDMAELCSHEGANETLPIEQALRIAGIARHRRHRRHRSRFQFWHFPRGLHSRAGAR